MFTHGTSRSPKPSDPRADPDGPGGHGGPPPIPGPTGLARAVHGVAHVSARFRKTTILLWVLLVIGCIVGGGMTGMKEIGEDDGVGESGRAAEIVAKTDLADRPTEVVLIKSDSRAKTDQVAAALQREIKSLKQVEKIESPLPGGGGIAQLRNDAGTAVLLHLTLRGSPEDAAKSVLPIERAVRAAQKDAPQGVQLAQTGAGSIDNAIDEMVESDLKKAELISVPLTLLILVLVFGAFVAASVPLILGITSVAAAMGAMGVVSQVAPMAEATGSLVVLIGLAVGVDYSLFYIRREREERKAGNTLNASLSAASASVGRAILVAGFTVMVALAGLLMTGVDTFTSMAAGTILVVFIAVLGSLTVLPAMLALLGDKIDNGRLGLPGAKRRRQRRAATAAAATAARIEAGLPQEPARRQRRKAWAVIADAVTRAPKTAFAVALVLLLALAAPVATMKLADSSTGSLPKGIPAVEAAAEVEQAFPGAPDSAELVITGDGLGSAAAKSGLAELGREAAEVTGGKSAAQVDIASGGKVAVVSVPVPKRSASAGQELARELRAQIPTIAQDLVPGADETLIAGDSAESLDFADAVKDAIPLVGGFVMGLAFILLLGAFRSVRLSLAVIGLNVISVAAAFGVMTVVFQNTWAEELLQFTSSGAIVTWMPLIAFVILFGLSMDYSILVLERIREARVKGRSPREAAAEGVAATASTVTGAAMVMVAVFAIFATLRMLEMKQLGIGMAAAILIDATIVRAFALPAVVTLLGEKAFGGIKPVTGAPQAHDDAVAWHDDAVVAAPRNELVKAGANG